MIYSENLSGRPFVNLAIDMFDIMKALTAAESVTLLVFFYKPWYYYPAYER
jgi:hypothetical protein